MNRDKCTWLIFLKRLVYTRKIKNEEENKKCQSFALYFNSGTFLTLRLSQKHNRSSK